VDLGDPGVINASPSIYSDEFWEKVGSGRPKEFWVPLIREAFKLQLIKEGEA
jgi:hypothetical protein